MSLSRIRPTTRAPLLPKQAGLLLVLLLTLAYAVAAVAAEHGKLIIHQPLPNVEGKSFSAIQVDFPPGARAAPHRHGQAFVFAYVVSGTIRSQLEGQPARTYSAGESWTEPPGAHHVLTENVSSKHPARLLAVFVSDTGAPLKVDDQTHGDAQ